MWSTQAEKITTSEMETRRDTRRATDVVQKSLQSDPFGPHPLLICAVEESEC